jgi:hypothetical protein
MKAFLCQYSYRDPGRLILFCDPAVIGCGVKKNGNEGDKNVAAACRPSPRQRVQHALGSSGFTVLCNNWNRMIFGMSVILNRTCLMHYDAAGNDIQIKWQQNQHFVLLLMAY